MNFENNFEKLVLKVKLPSNPEPSAWALSKGQRFLIIAINYTGSFAQLSGCESDAKRCYLTVLKLMGCDLNTKLTDEQKNRIWILTDDVRSRKKKHPKRSPTVDNIKWAFKTLATTSTKGDNIFIHYSGHGIQQKTDNSDESDGMCENLCAVDFGTKGFISDSFMSEQMHLLASIGAQLTFVNDSCHSATFVEAPYKYDLITFDRKKLHSWKKMKLLALVCLIFLKLKERFLFFCFFLGVLFGFMSPSHLVRYQKSKGLSKNTRMKILSVAACKDVQTAGEKQINKIGAGKMSYAFYNLLNMDINQPIHELLKKLATFSEQKQEFTINGANIEPQDSFMFLNDYKPVISWKIWK